MYNIGDKVKIITHEGLYEIIASKDNPKKTAHGIIPLSGYDYALKRIDGYMASNFEPYIYVNESQIDKD